MGLPLSQKTCWMGAHSASAQQMTTASAAGSWSAGVAGNWGADAPIDAQSMTGRSGWLVIVGLNSLLLFSAVASAITCVAESRVGRMPLGITGVCCAGLVLPAAAVRRPFCRAVPLILPRPVQAFQTPAAG